MKVRSRPFLPAVNTSAAFLMRIFPITGAYDICKLPHAPVAPGRNGLGSVRLYSAALFMGRCPMLCSFVLTGRQILIPRLYTRGAASLAPGYGLAGLSVRRATHETADDT